MSTKGGSSTRRRGARTDVFDRRAYAVCVCLASLWAVIHFRADLAMLAPSWAPQQEHDSGLATGTILVYSHDGDVCMQRSIDNATWRIHDGGVVNCAKAQVQSAERWHEEMSDRRTVAIRDSFSKR